MGLGAPSEYKNCIEAEHNAPSLGVFDDYELQDFYDQIQRWQPAVLDPRWKNAVKSIAAFTNRMLIEAGIAIGTANGYYPKSFSVEHTDTGLAEENFGGEQL